MKVDADTAIDSLVRFVQVIGEDPELRDRFYELAELSPVQRSFRIETLAAQMETNLKDPELVAFFRLFGDARVFDAAMLALRNSG